MGWAPCRGSLEGRSAEARDRGDRSSRGRLAEQLAQVSGRTECEPITLQRGVTHDVEFERWASLAFTRDGAMSLKNFRKDLVIGLLNEQGTVVPAYRV